ncbi:MAG: TonB-dependent receptor, partial [Eudoraea sp.]|nr:TonB-dependent receptor [Eudoraea sp.]NNJ40296.1 TonB-dependent receptor [Eudoraea sp.]
TLYDAYSLFGAISLDLGSANQLSGYALLARNRRGRSAPITEEVFDLAGRTYNPNWGWMGGRIRNARERVIEEPICGFNYKLQTQALKFRIGLAYKSGFQNSGRLGYYEAPNPDPTYYRYLPSYYINNEFGINFKSAQQVADEFIGKGQIPWNSLYLANSNNAAGKASYVLYSDVIKGNTWTTSLNTNLKISRALQLDFGLSYRNTRTSNFSRLEDLLGAAYHLDIDPFSDTKNDMQGTLQKQKGEPFAYNYRLHLRALDSYVQLQLNTKHWEAFTTMGWGYRSSQRIGEFQNARYPDNSQGPGPLMAHSGLGLKGGFGYKPNGRIAFNINGLFQTRPPLPKNVFINPRDNDNFITYNMLPTVTSVEGNTLIRFPKLIGRISGFSTWFRNESEIGFYYTDTGLGSDFVQEVLTDVSKVHQGLEFGLEYKLSSAVALTFAGTYSAYRYANNPEASLHFDVSENDQNPIDPSGSIALGKAELNGIKLARGPQKALSFGVSYRDPDFWFVSATLNQLGDNYMDSAVLPRTESFYLDPATRETATNIDSELVSGMLKQSPLPRAHILNLIGGKSWLIKGRYLGVFASINNVLDATFRTGGFQQSRNGHYDQFIKDNLSTRPSFAPKYWYGYGRTYFINLSLSF